MLLFWMWQLTHAPWFILSACLWKSTCWRCCKVTVLMCLIAQVVWMREDYNSLSTTLTEADADILVKPKYWPIYRSTSTYNLVCFMYEKRTTCFQFLILCLIIRCTLWYEKYSKLGRTLLKNNYLHKNFNRCCIGKNTRITTAWPPLNLFWQNPESEHTSNNLALLLGTLLKQRHDLEW